MAGLVPLQGPDQVPADRHVRQLLLFGQRFLHPVLSDVLQPGGQGSPNRLGSLRLGHRHDPDRMGPSASGLVVADSVTDRGEPVGEPREIHNPEI